MKLGIFGLLCPVLVLLWADGVPTYNFLSTDESYFKDTSISNIIQLIAVDSALFAQPIKGLKDDVYLITNMIFP